MKIVNRYLVKKLIYNGFIIRIFRYTYKHKFKYEYELLPLSKTMAYILVNKNYKNIIYDRTSHVKLRSCLETAYEFVNYIKIPQFIYNINRYY